MPIGCGGGSGTAGLGLRARLGLAQHAAMLLGIRRLLGRWQLLSSAPPARGYRGEAVAAVGSPPDAGSALYQVG